MQIKKNKSTEILLINIGNTNTSFVLYENSRLAEINRIPTDIKRIKTNSLSKIRNIDYFVIASVVPRVTKIMKKTIKGKMIEIKNSDINIKNLYKNKSEAGVDRLLESFAAKEKYGIPLVVVDFGTATTFNAVSKKGEFKGGMILPGVNMWEDYLKEKTSKLPRVKFANTNKLIGSTAKECIQSGIFYGNIDMISGLIRRLKKSLGEKTKIVATGGFAKYISPYIKEINKVDRLLVFDGMIKTAEKIILQRLRRQRTE